MSAFGKIVNYGRPKVRCDKCGRISSDPQSYPMTPDLKAALAAVPKLRKHFSCNMQEPSPYKNGAEFSNDLLIVMNALLKSPADFAAELGAEPAWHPSWDGENWFTQLGVYNVSKGGFTLIQGGQVVAGKTTGADIDKAKAACLADCHARLRKMLRGGE